MIPEQKDNPNGLHRRYNISKADGGPIDPTAVYFVLRFALTSCCRFLAYGLTIAAGARLKLEHLDWPGLGLPSWELAMAPHQLVTISIRPSSWFEWLSG